MQTLLRTPLYERHVALGARMVPFAGWEMPVQYEGVIPEHKAVREDCGVFDVSHMGRFEFEGPKVPAALQRLLSNDVEKVDVGGAQYTLLTNETGGIIDDLIVYRVEGGRFFLIVNASNREADFEWIEGHGGAGTDLRDKTDEFALLAVQGPRSLERLGLDEATAVHVRDGRGGRDRGDGQSHGLYGREGRRADGHGRGRGGSLGRCGRAGSEAVRAGRARHAAPRGLLPAPRQRHRPRHGRDLGRPRLGLRARHGVHRGRGAAPGQGGRAGPEARRLRHARPRNPQAGHGHRGGRPGHVRLALADARPRDRNGLRRRRAARTRERRSRSTSAASRATRSWSRNRSTRRRNR